MNIKSLLLGDDLGPLEYMLSNFPACQSIQVTSSSHFSDTTNDTLFKVTPDLMFVDLRLVGSSNFESIYNGFCNKLMPAIIFVLPRYEHLINYFENMQLNFIVRPFDQLNLMDVMRKALARCDMQKLFNRDNKYDFSPTNAYTSAKDILNILGITPSAIVQLPHEKKPKLCVSDSGSKIYIEQEDIIWVDAAGDYMCIHTNSETFVIRHTLKHLLEQLSHEIFVRIHKSTIINIDYVKKISHISKGDYSVILNCGKHLKGSRNFKFNA